MPPTQPADPYKPSAALQAAIRARDGYCTTPGCDRPAWTADLDHITEHNPDDPDSGRTRRENITAKCRMHHNLKTHGDWLDDLIIDPDGKAA